MTFENTHEYCAVVAEEIREASGGNAYCWRRHAIADWEDVIADVSSERKEYVGN